MPMRNKPCNTLVCILFLAVFFGSISHADVPGLQVLSFGDSITQGFARDAQGHRWGVETPPRGQRITWWGYGMYLERLLHDALRENSLVFNWGYGGLRSNQALDCGQDWDCIDSVLASREADLILIMLGANDLYGGISHTATTFNLSVMLDKSLAAGAQPVLGAITPNSRVPGYDDRIRNHYNPLLRDLAQTKRIVFADHHAAMAARWDQVYSSGDGLHLGDAGNQRLAESWFQAFKDDLVEVFLLNVQSGTGGGEYRERRIIRITADPPDEGKVFNRWFGDTEYIVSPVDMETTLVMPAANATVRASYRNPPDPESIPALSIWGVLGLSALMALLGRSFICKDSRLLSMHIFRRF